MSGKLCGAKAKTGRPCRRPAGWGTPHVGRGRCKMHLGNAPNHLKAAAKEEAQALGGLVEISSPDALAWLVHRAAGMVGHWEDKLAEQPEDPTTRDLHSEALERLRVFAKTAADAKVDEQRGRLAEAQAAVLYRAVALALDELGLSAADRRRVGAIIERELRALEPPAGPSAAA